jgi:hypothetical protein
MPIQPPTQWVRWDDPEELEEAKAFDRHREKHRRPLTYPPSKPPKSPAPPKPQDHTSR